LPEDVDDIIHYIDSINYGINRMKDFPLSLRLIKETHKTLMTGARSTHSADPGHFRQTQNWIGGSNINNAIFVPPPVEDMKHSMGELEKFIHNDDHILPALKSGIIHGQFETIHPFLDGNGRTGRLLITLYLMDKKLLDYPVLFLSNYFKKHQQLYYQCLNGYHHGHIEVWLNFFLDGIIETVDEAITTAKKITQIREEDSKKMHALGKTAAKTSIEVLINLYKLPIVNVNKIKDWTGFTRQGAQKVIDRFVDLEILKQKDESKSYGRSFIYKRYVDIFNE
jgi:Fic family protein